jgi:hypothetical protein
MSHNERHDKKQSKAAIPSTSFDVQTQHLRVPGYSFEKARNGLLFARGKTLIRFCVGSIMGGHRKYDPARGGRQSTRWFRRSGEDRTCADAG